MNHPDSAQEGAPDEAGRLRLQELREALLILHKALLQSEQATYEAVFGPVQSTNHLLQLALNDPWFSWLRPLSTLLARMDASLDDKKLPLTGEMVRSLLDTTRVMLRSADGQDAGFSAQYKEALQRDPEVVMAHADVALCLARP